MKYVKSGWEMLKKTATQWSDDRAITLSAALSYYTVFSAAPLILITVALVGLVFGHDASQGEIFDSIRGLIGVDGAKTVESMVEASAQRSSGIIASIIGIVTLLLGASSVFGQLQDSLNMIWRVQSKPGRGIWMLLRQRFLSFSMMLVVAFLLLVSLVVSAALAAIGKYASSHLPGGEGIWQVLNTGVSFSIITLLFAAIYKILPDVQLAWRDVWTGAAFTSLFFSLGKLVIGLYIGHSGVASAYGAAGSALVILIWAYYSSALLFFGAEYTRVYATWKGKKILPKEGVEFLKISPAN